MNIRELLAQRATLIAQARGLLDKAEEEKRELGAEEQAQWDTLLAEADALKKKADREERMLAGEQSLTTRQMDPPDTAKNDPEKRKLEVFQAGLRGFVLGEMSAPEVRALQQDLGASGGYLVPPLQWVNDLIRAVDNQVFIRQWATKYTVTGADGLGVPALDANPAAPVWTSELLFGTEDSTMAFGRRELKPKPLAKYIKVSKKLLRTIPSVDSLVMERLAYVFAITEEAAFLTGDGATAPLGLMTASNDGISTSYDCSTGNAATSITFDGLTSAKFTLKPQYRANARWLFHTDGVCQIAKLKDGEGQYIWRESVRVGEPDRILGMPVFESQYMSNTFTTGLYVGILGDFRN